MCVHVRENTHILLCACEGRRSTWFESGISSHRCMCLNTWSPAGEALWGPLGWSLAGRNMTVRWPLRFHSLPPHHHQFSLFLKCVVTKASCAAQDACYTRMDHILSGIISHINPFSLKLLSPGYYVKEVGKNKQTNKYIRSLLQLFSVMLALSTCHNLESPKSLHEGLSTLT